MQRRRPGAAHRRPFLTAAAAAVLIQLLLLSAVVAADDAAAGTPAILDTVCAATQAADPEGFDVSFVTTLEMIYQNVTRSGFGAAGSGAGNNTVFGLGQCMSYLSPTDCQLCYAQSRVKLPHCLPADGGRIYLDGCFLRYGADNFTATATDASDTAVCSNATATVATDGTGSDRDSDFRGAAAAWNAELSGCAISLRVGRCRIVYASLSRFAVKEE
ncbi:unnamed protein product [Miscanthus lutarioriparius]|uniref:Gnk2-homologous domain-containing protein n=1 Tax=Miscanthus lutarioriparius TaxID=422564 RepID=A0A811RXR1_9POAL|nr:unnamed protein product [Miscanthus lutarioriparius]